MSRVPPWIAREVAEVVRTTRVRAQAACRRASLVLLAALLALAGSGFLLSAAYLTLTRHLDAEYAGLIIGGALFGSALLLFLYTRWRRPPQAPADPTPDPSAGSTANDALAPRAAFVAAFVLARQLRRRQTR